MDLLSFVQEYVIAPYPTNMSLFRWRSEESQAAVALLRQRVGGNDLAGTQRALDYLRGVAVPAADPAVTGLAALDQTGRLWGLLSSVQHATAIPVDYQANPPVQLRAIWPKSTSVVTGALATADLDALGWLSYFYKEKGTFANLRPPDRERMVEFLNVFYTRPVQLDLNPLHNDRLATPGPTNAWLDNNALPRRMDGLTARLVNLGTLNADTMPLNYKVWQFFYREAMMALLRSGFVPIAECNPQHQIVGQPAAPVLTAHNGLGDLNTTQLRVAGANQTVGAVSYCWRGDTRSPAELRDVGGLWCKAESEGYARAKNMRKAWHPFNDPQVRRYMYFRCAQKDNCLYTAVSVTPAAPLNAHGRFDFTQVDNQAFRINACFPQLEEIPAADRKNVRIELTNINTGVPGSTICQVDDVQIYLCRLPALTNFVDTHWLQEQLNPGSGFPEIALRGIPVADLMGYITFIRVHHHDDNISGFTAIPVDNRSRNMTVGGPATALYNTANALFEAAWGPAGVQAPGRPWNGLYTITRVAGMPVNAGRIAMYVPHQTLF